MKNYPKVYIICGVHNQLKHAKRLLKCIKEQTYRNIQSIIIDDGSSDGTYEYINKNHQEVLLLRGDGNLWWTGALYLGVETVLAKENKDAYILTINCDCEFDRNYVNSLVDQAKLLTKCIIGSVVIDSSDKNCIVDAGVRIDWFRGKLIPLGPKKIQALPSSSMSRYEIDVLPTKGTLYPLELFAEVGNFDRKHLPHYISDYEFCFRAKKSGYKIVVNFEAKIYNDIGETGIGGQINCRITMRQWYEFLFARKSRLNIVDHYWFITLCCPLIYKPLNYLYLLIKSIFILSYVAPFYYLRELIIGKNLEKNEK